MIHSPPNSQVGVHTDNKLRQVNLSFPIFYGKQHYRHISYYENKKVIAEYKYVLCLINAKHPHSVRTMIEELLVCCKYQRYNRGMKW